MRPSSGRGHGGVTMLNATPLDDDVFNKLSLEQLRRRRSSKWRDVGPDELPAWVAESDFPLPASVEAALIEAVQLGDTGYSPTHSSALARAFADFAHRHWDWQVHPADVTPVPDAIAAVEMMLRRVTRPGDTVAMFLPAYQPFFETVAELGLRIAPLRLTADHRSWAVDFDRVADVFSGGARVLLLSNPHNPTGKCYSSDELYRLADLASRFNVFVISDEVHAPVMLDGAHTAWPTIDSPSALNSVVVTGASKAFNLAGLKCALLVTAGTAGALADDLPVEFRPMTGHLGMMASTLAYTSEDAWLAGLRRHLARNVDSINTWVANRADVRWIPPQGSYLAWLDLRQTPIADSPARHITARSGLVVIDGTEFDRSRGGGWVRLNFGTTQVILDEILARLGFSIDALPTDTSLGQSSASAAIQP